MIHINALVTLHSVFVQRASLFATPDSDAIPDTLPSAPLSSEDESMTLPRDDDDPPTLRSPSRFAEEHEAMLEKNRDTSAIAFVGACLEWAPREVLEDFADLHMRVSDERWRLLACWAKFRAIEMKLVMSGRPEQAREFAAHAGNVFHDLPESDRW